MEHDIWAEWLQRRHTHTKAHRAHQHAQILNHTNHMLNGAKLRPGITVLDVGAGEGNAGFRALEQAGSGTKIIFTDISAKLLATAQAEAARHNLLSQCQFLQTPACSLALVANLQVDTVISRAALAYEANKQAAFAAFFRVLRPGGRLSLAEPVFHDEALAATALTLFLQARPPSHPDQFLPLLQRLKAAQFPTTEAAITQSLLTNYTERDLVRFAQQAGFSQIHMEFHINIEPEPPLPWEDFLAQSPHPLAPATGTFIAQHFTPQEQNLFTSILRPVIEQTGPYQGGHHTTSRVAYLTACKA